MMELEEALSEIERLKGELETTGSATKKAIADGIETFKTEHEKELQVQFNKGFDKAKNAKEDEIKNAYIKKEDVESMLSERDQDFARRTTLAKLGVKNPKRAMKLIDDEDLKAFGSDDFDEEKFRTKYAEDIVFGGGKNKQDDPKKTSSNLLKNNKDPKTELTAEKFEAMTADERAKVPLSVKASLL